MYWRTCSGVGNIRSVPKFITAGQQAQRRKTKRGKHGRHHGQALPRRDVRHGEKAVAEAIYRIEDGIPARNGLPEWRQAVYGVKHTRQEGGRHDQEVLEGRKLIE